MNIGAFALLRATTYYGSRGFVEIFLVNQVIERMVFHDLANRTGLPGLVGQTAIPTVRERPGKRRMRRAERVRGWR